MSFTKIEKRGEKEYAYEVTSYWDKKKKSPRQKKRYLGIVIDKEKKIFEKREKNKMPEKLILDFGDSYIISKFLDKIGFVQFLNDVFGKHSSWILCFLTYRLCYPSAMKYASTWYEGNYAKLLYKDVTFQSQRISDFFKIMGEESLQRTFFKEYISRFTNAKNGIVIDATSLPNQIHFPLNAWGRSGEEIDKQIRFLLVVDKELELPLFFRHYAGDIVDVTTLKTTLLELREYGIKQTFVCFDAGYFSEENIKELQIEKIPFLTRMPAGRILFKDLIKNHVKMLEHKDNIVRYGKRGLFIKQVKIDLFGQEAYAHIVLDPQRKGREMNQFLLQTEANDDEFEYSLLTKGVMILVSSYHIPKEDVVPAYYVRQTAEKLFGFSKDDLELLPLRVHNEETLRGFLFLQFLTLIIFIKLKQYLGEKYTVEEALLELRNLRCKVYDKDILISEKTKKQRMIVEKLEIIVPKTLGI